MFTNLIESDSHGKEFKRRSSFFLVTTATYALFLFAAGIASIYAYDARLEVQSTDLMLLSWVPPVTPVADRRPRETSPARRPAPSNAPVDRTATLPTRTEAYAPTNNPNRVPDNVGTKAPYVPSVTGPFRLGNTNVNPPTLDTSNRCATCSGTGPVVNVVETTPPPVPTPVKPQTQRLTSSVLTSKAISIPKPLYPPLARQIRVEGTVAVQILVDENGRVISAHAVSGHPTLTPAAVEAAYRARFTATLLSGQPVKVQGVITYNFVLQ